MLEKILELKNMLLRLLQIEEIPTEEIKQLHLKTVSQKFKRINQISYLLYHL
jgi:hypothetical protein